MAATDDELLQWIETGLWYLPAVPGLNEDLSVPGVIGRATPSVSHPFVNLVGAAHWTDTEADTRIAEVSAYFQERNLPFIWLIGPSTTPADLPDRLQRAGFHKAVELAGMVLTDLTIPISVNPEVHIREVPDLSEALTYRELLGAAYGMPPEVAEVLVRQSFHTPEAGAAPYRFHSTLYIAHLGDDPTPVSFAVSIRADDSSLVLLSGAGTVPELRGHGIYTALVARRLADARAHGCTDAVIQAVRDTSAPICAKLGFHERCGLEFYVRYPTPEPIAG